MDDYETVGALTVAAYEPFLLGPDDFYIPRLRDAALRDREAELWVAEVDGEVAGSLTLCPPVSPWREIAGDGEGEFRMLGVSPAHQGRGVGRALTEHAIGRFTADGASHVVLSSLDTMTTAHRMYERLGFVRAPERDWTPQPDVSLIAYIKELP